ncbi:hypothetical protein B0T26DRAFT_467281 [Lasiosphaeria miniovina]|uniref:DUF2470 domain-containing protein n=1 Tax=Lasiosphaeria miniovina TaxID=1954250 RepID=A0AA39ZZX3_9PEZI|nr:uncharacterized protein B0T26DRAFT_467281 [Lasiosphaeria miniovina]KAK0706679.1 hypothetical protein B0T26DRAFT_467281 [Lasiosphaeria miniovina]
MASSSSSSAIPVAAKARTLAHMNKDHRADLAHMLQHFNGVPATDAELLDMDLASLTVRTGTGDVHNIAIDPPLAAWDDRRQRLIDMTLAARAGLGIATTTPDTGHHPVAAAAVVVVVGNRFRPPQTPLEVAVFGGVTLYFVTLTLVMRGVFDDGAAGAETLQHILFWSGAPAALRWLVAAIFVPTVVAHVVEAVHLHRSRLRRYGVPALSPAWCGWIACALFEGMTTFKRFDRLVGELERKGA